MSSLAFCFLFQPSKSHNIYFVTSDFMVINIFLSNIIFSHGGNNKFSSRGIEIAINYFLKRGHPKVVAFVSESVRYGGGRYNFPRKDRDLLEQLIDKGHVKVTPARRIPNGRTIVAYEDR